MFLGICGFVIRQHPLPSLNYQQPLNVSSDMSFWVQGCMLINYDHVHRTWRACSSLFSVNIVIGFPCLLLYNLFWCLRPWPEGHWTHIFCARLCWVYPPNSFKCCCLDSRCYCHLFFYNHLFSSFPSYFFLYVLCWYHKKCKLKQIIQIITA
jgi:hypothetical protein